LAIVDGSTDLHAWNRPPSKTAPTFRSLVVGLEDDPVIVAYPSDNPQFAWTLDVFSERVDVVDGSSEFLVSLTITSFWGSFFSSSDRTSSGFLAVCESYYSFDLVLGLPRVRNDTGMEQV
jgi:hypothetical protein